MTPTLARCRSEAPPCVCRQHAAGWSPGSDLSTGSVTPASTVPRLVLVSAPAGSGKTTLLTQWLSPSITAGGSGAVLPRAIWLSLDAADDEVRAFLAHLVGALQLASPDAADEIERLLESDAAPVEDVVAGVVDELDVLAGATVVVLDDYHVIDAPEVHAAVAFLLENLPPQVSVAMTTRADPALPLARLRARGELVEVRAADLRFTPDEASAFLDDVMGLRLAPEQVATLVSRTEGWAAGLQLAALSALGRVAPGEAASDGAAAFIEAFSGSNRFVLDYLVEEVLDSLTVRLRDFLLDTAVLDELTGPLCDAVTGGDDGQELLEELERRNVFLVPLDDERTWFRYHHLFADALRARSRADSDRVGRLHRAAADWHAEHGTLSVAVDHALAGGDAEHAADLVEVALPGARRRREDMRLRTWLNALPEAVLSSRALLATQMVPARLSEGDLDGAERWLELGEAALSRPELVVPVRVPGKGPAAAAAAARDDELGALQAQTAVYRAAVSQGRGDVEGTLAHARRALDLAGAHDHVARSGGAGFLGLAAWAAGDVTTAVAHFGETVRSLRAAGNVTDELGTTVVLADLWLARGRPARAREMYEAALARADTRPAAVVAVTGDLHTGLAAVLREQGEFAAAEAHLQSARALGERASLPENRYRWFTTTADLLASTGDLPGAVTMLDRAETEYRPGYLPDVRPIAARRARVWIAQGRLDLAQEWARDRQMHVDGPDRFSAEYEQLVLARLLVAQHRPGPGAGNLAAAVDLLDQLVTAAAAADRDGSLVEALVVRATAYQARGDVDAAVNDVGRSLAAAVPAGYRRLFLDEGPVVRDLLRSLEARPGAPGAEAAAALLRAVDLAGPAPGRRSAVPTAVGHEAMSPRELEVLQLLATDLSGPEIAERLYLSINTFRTHTRHVFTKLDVTTRRAAVTRAGALGVLPQS